ncbi:hypothetical protein SD71_01165 [Cohnella kolymensis]|uniref:Rhamnogalacturonan lyase domain-containing protein n=1 Tax=Cohnella kolymensis TaxID=1590652 RepID=A0ABR5A8U5_9BACL|nr:carboxypeptidase regulatory-like domain-containing protein [Cohnella kolymensis]KIL37327.1 hypothetical protein SD71_01165 [Cohnella kolymensis]
MNWTKRLMLTGGLLCVILLLTATFAAAEDPGKSIAQRVLKLEQFVTDIQGVFTGQQQDIDSIHTTNQQQTAEITEIKRLLAEQQELTASLQSKVNNDVAALQQQLAEQQGITGGLQAQISELQARISQLEKPNVPVEKHRVSGTMVDVNGKTFFSGFELISSNGTHYPRTTGNTETGAFTFEQIPNGTYDVHFYYNGYKVDSPKQITINGSDITDLQVKLSVPTFTVSGKATFADGTAMAHQGISLIDPHNIGGYWQGTNEQGEFTISGIAPGEYTLQIGQSNGAVAQTTIRVTDSDLTGVELKSDSNKPQLNVQGEVTLENELIANATVRLMDRGGYYGDMTNAQGAYNIAVREAGSYPLVVAEQGYKFGYKSNLTVTNGTPTIADIVMAEGGIIDGRIQRADGSGIPNVSAKVLDGSGNMINRIYTNNNGTYQLNAPAGSYTLLIEADGRQPIDETLNVTPGQTITRDFTL